MNQNQPQNTKRSSFKTFLISLLVVHIIQKVVNWIQKQPHNSPSAPAVNRASIGRHLVSSHAVNIYLTFIFVALLNVASLYIFTRFDFTENSIYSISKPTKDLIGNLDDRLTVKAYFSKDLPAPYNNVSQFVRDLLQEYKAYGKGNVYYEFINPGDDQKLEEEAMSFRVPPLQVNALEKDKIELKKVYMGLVFLYQNNQEVLPVISKTTGLEYDITSAIKRLMSTEKPAIGILQGHGEPSLSENLQTLKAALDKQYDVQPVQLSAVNSIPQNLKLALLIAPQDTFNIEDLYKIDQFIMNGGKMGFFFNEHDVQLDKGSAQPLTTNLSPLLQQYGIKINNDIVMDMNCAPISVSQQQGFFQIVNQVAYPFFPIFDRLNREHIIVKDLERLVHFFPSSLDTSLAGKMRIQVTALATTSEKSTAQTGRFDVNPMQQYDPQDFNDTSGQGYVVSAVYTGMFQSYFTSDQQLIPVSVDRNLFKQKSEENRIVVIAEGNFIKDEYLQSVRENTSLALNTADWLAQDEDLILIRSREVTARPLKAPENAAIRNLIRWLNILLPPIIIIAIGLIMTALRKNRLNRLIVDLK